MNACRAVCRLYTPLAPTRTRVRLNNPGYQAKWTPGEDLHLIDLVGNSPEPDWNYITSQLPGKTVHQVVDRWEKVVNPNLVKGSWTREEDELIINWVRTHGATGWTQLAEKLPGRIGKQCRERWHNGLNPDLVRTTWLPEEDQLIEKLQHQWGNKWARIAELLPGRTDNAVKNRWNSTLKRRSQSPQQQSTTTGNEVLPPPTVPIPFVVVDCSDQMASSFITSTELEISGIDTFEMEWKDRQMDLFDMAPKFEGFDRPCPPLGRDDDRLAFDSEQQYVLD
jgi:hypothetical protein